MNFFEIEPRENAGSRTSGRYDYQKDLSIWILLEYHENCNDYLFVFDYHDDLVVFDSEVTPKAYAFFQIKSNQSNKWKLNRILHRKKRVPKVDDEHEEKKDESENSILGKLYLHKVNFKENVESLNFISNASFDCKLSNGGKGLDLNEICLEDLCKEDKDNIQEKLKKEFGISEMDLNFTSQTFFKVSELSIKDSGTHTIGKIDKFLSNKFPNHKTVSAKSVYQNLFDDIKMKSANDKVVTTLEQLIRTKGISRSYFENILSLIGANKNYDQIWIDVKSGVESAGVQFGDILKYKNLWAKIEVERMDSTNNILRELINGARDTINNEMQISAFQGLNILEVVNQVRQKMSAQICQRFSEEYISTVIFSELYG
jgi:hypothetical protein